ncbi:MAG: chromate resistance protein ChrB domain-containing protein [Burkholderiales bacterium]
MHFIALILSLPTENATVRMRAWRALKASGAAVLRDGVYLMPEHARCRSLLDTIAVDVQSGGGAAFVLRVEEPEGANFARLFDRSEDFAALLNDITKIRGRLTTDTGQEMLRHTRKLRKAFDGLVDADYFPGEARKQVDTALQELELSVARVLTPDEPHPIEGAISKLKVSEYQGRTWATRRRPWVDRLACAWLIRRFIDPQARMLWLETVNDCPANAVGFDFDGATFSHVGSQVTFEVLLASFDLVQAGLRRLGALVHHLDIGGIQQPESAGLECVLAGLRETITNDDQLLATASGVFDGLLATFQQENTAQQRA